MFESTVTDKGQTTLPKKLREKLGIKSGQRILWDFTEDGRAIMLPQPSALSLFGSLKSPVEFQGIKEEKEAARQAMALEAAQEDEG